MYLNLADYQDMYYGGAGMVIRTYAFDLDRNTIDVETFSPWIQRQKEADRNVHERQLLERTEPQSRFSLPVDFKALAQRWTRSPPPAEVATGQPSRSRARSRCGARRAPAPSASSTTSAATATT